MSKPFHFKQFVVHQSDTAMKVGTDGVLLGAWANPSKTFKVLDIGTGTGLIALMMAQRYKESQITAIELDNKAFLEAQNNFLISPWSDRLTAVEGNIIDYSFSEKFDVIVSNPPFYNSTFKQLDEKRAMARHTQSLSYSDLLSAVNKWLTHDGKFYTIIPFEEESVFINIAEKIGLFANEICRVKGNALVEYKRSLLAFSFNSIPTKISELVIEKSRGEYTDDYIALTREFYLKM